MAPAAAPADAGSPCTHGFITELVLRCGRGDAGALKELFDLFYRPVSAAVGMSAPPDRVESAVARVFVQIWREAPFYRAESGSAVRWVMARAGDLPAPVSPRPAPSPVRHLSLRPTGVPPALGAPAP